MKVKNRGEVLVLLIREDKSKFELDLLDLRNDVVFKSFFGDRRNNKLLLDFLRAVLGEKIKSVTLTNPYVEPSHANDKSSEMDLRMITDKEEQINVEMQFQGHKAFRERMLIYWAKMYGVQDNISKPYGELNKAFQVVITNFNLLSKPHYRSMFQLIDPEDGSLFSSHMEIHVIELSKITDLRLQGATKLEQWLLFLEGDKETKEALAMESTTMKEAYEEIQRLSDDKETRKAAIARDIHLRDQVQREFDAKEEGEKKGRIEGKVDGIAEVALNMHKKQFTIEAIAAATNLSMEDVLRIVKSNIQ